MKLFLFPAALLFTAVATAQTCPQNYLGTKTLYPVTPQHSTPPPKGYSPLFINHVGRHGARHLTKDVASSYAFAAAAKADSLQALTADGKKLHDMVSRLEKIEKKDFESISAEGKKEQQGLAKRMATAYPEIFDANPAINVRVAKKLRTSQSADAFLSGLPEATKAPDLKKVVNDTILRFYDMAPAYVKFEKSGPWQPAFDQFKKQLGYKSIASGLAQRFFAPSFAAQMSDTDKETFLDDLYGFATIVPSLNAEILKADYRPADVAFAHFFTCTQLGSLARIGDAEDFLVKGPGTDAAGIQVKIAAPLLMDFINTTDAALANGKPSVQLRFSHAETVAPFAALLGLQGAATSVKNLNEVSGVWQGARVIPLSANVQWIFYQKPDSKEYLMKFLLNEKETTIEGLKPMSFPYYKWTDVRDFYTRKLQSLNTSLADNGYRFLQSLN